MRRLILPAAAGLLLSACAQPGVEAVTSQKSAVELRAIQTRLVPAESGTVLRGVVATMHDLGYRITRADPASGTVSGTRATELRLAAVVQPRGPNQSVVRANATVVSARREAQVDAPEFYARNFFEPLGATLQRRLAAVPDDVSAPEPARPAAELNTLKERRAAAAAAGRPAPATGGQPQPTGTPTR